MVAYTCHPKIQDPESRRSELQSSLRYTARPCCTKQILWKHGVFTTSEAIHPSCGQWPLTELQA